MGVTKVIGFLLQFQISPVSLGAAKSASAKAECGDTPGNDWEDRFRNSFALRP